MAWWIPVQYLLTVSRVFKNQPHGGSPKEKEIGFHFFSLVLPFLFFRALPGKEDVHRQLRGELLHGEPRVHDGGSPTWPHVLLRGGHVQRRAARPNAVGGQDRGNTRDDHQCLCHQSLSRGELLQLMRLKPPPKYRWRRYALL